LTHFVEARGRNLTELAVAWLLAQPQIASVIAGATAPEHVAANVTAADWALNADELSEVNVILSSG
jgi:aryl-alcohol dehydrogenase-like predicted oxidoreductase